MVLCLVHFVHISWSFICRDFWRPILKMGSTRKNCPVSATSLGFLPNSSCMHACVCAYMSVHVYDTPCSMSFDWHNHVITGSWLWILREDTLLHPMQSLQIGSFICLPLARIVGWLWAGHWDVFTCALYYTGYVALGGLVVCRVPHTRFPTYGDP